MKKTKNRILSMLMAVVLVIGMITPVFAVEEQDAIGVMINGQMVTFSEAKPANLAGRTMVPFRDVFEAMGAKVSFDSATNTVSAVLGEKSVSFKEDSKELKITQNGDTQVKTVDVPPYIDPQTGKTYVPVRFAAESFGYTVSWDSAKKTVVMIDVEKLTQNINQKFSVFNLIMQADTNRYKTPVKVTGDVDYQIVVKETGMAPAMEMNMTADMEAVELLSDMEMSMNIKIDFDKMFANLPDVQKAAMATILDQYRSIPVTMKMDGKNGVFYFKSDIFNLSPIPLPDGRTIDGNTWLKMDLNALGQMADNPVKMDYSEMMQNYSQYTTMEGLLNLILKSQSTFKTGSYQDITAGIAFIEELLGDGAFVKKPSLDFDTYVLNIDKDKLKAAAAVAYPLASEDTIAALADVMTALKGTALFNDMLTVNASYTIEDNKVRACTVDANVDLTGVTQGAAPIKYEMKVLQKTAYDSSVTMNMDLADMMTLYMEMNMIIKDVTQKPDVTVPQGEMVIDYMEMLSLLLVSQP